MDYPFPTSSSLSLCEKSSLSLCEKSSLSLCEKSSLNLIRKSFESHEIIPSKVKTAVYLLAYDINKILKGRVALHALGHKTERDTEEFISQLHSRKVQAVLGHGLTVPFCGGGGTLLGNYFGASFGKMALFSKTVTQGHCLAPLFFVSEALLLPEAKLYRESINV